uniref:Uncharacterized protein n=2 Tax=Lygus hesperus TaxID=30085 RepID=A0A0A9YIG9_LYGHE
MPQHVCCALTGCITPGTTCSSSHTCLLSLVCFLCHLHAIHAHSSHASDCLACCAHHCSRGKSPSCLVHASSPLSCVLRCLIFLCVQHTACRSRHVCVSCVSASLPQLTLALCALLAHVAVMMYTAL